MSRIIAFLFIGQTPRPDVMNDIRGTIGRDVEALEFGALDGLGDAEIVAMKPASAEDTLITKLSDGREVCVSEKSVAVLLEKRAVQAAEEGADLCAVMCTGYFELKSPIPVITADQAFHGQSFADGVKCVGVIVPLAEQQKTFARYYKGSGLEIIMGAADPYGDTAAIVSEAKRLAAAGANLIRLDCMGYTAAQASAARAATGLPVRTPRFEIIRLIQKEI